MLKFWPTIQKPLCVCLPIVVVNPALEVQSNALNLGPLWSSNHIGAPITANITNHTNFLKSALFFFFLTLMVIVAICTETTYFPDDERHPSCRQRSIAHTSMQPSKESKAKEERQFFFMSSLGSRLAPIEATAHIPGVQMYKKKRFLLPKLQIYLHLHFCTYVHQMLTHSSLFSMCHFSA